MFVYNAHAHLEPAGFPLVSLPTTGHGAEFFMADQQKSYSSRSREKKTRDLAAGLVQPLHGSEDKRDVRVSELDEDWDTISNEVRPHLGSGSIYS